MNEQLNDEITALITKLDPSETEQLNTLLKFLKHAQLYHATVQLMNPAQSK